MLKVTIDQFLTEKEIKKAMKLRTAKLIADQIITPNLERINAALGQENDPMFLGYAVEYVISQASRLSTH